MSTDEYLVSYANEHDGEIELGLNDSQEPIFPKEWIRYKGVPYLFAKDGRLFRLFNSNLSIDGYKLEELNPHNHINVLFNGLSVKKDEALSLL